MTDHSEKSPRARLPCCGLACSVGTQDALDNLPGLFFGEFATTVFVVKDDGLS